MVGSVLTEPGWMVQPQDCVVETPDGASIERRDLRLLPKSGGGVERDVGGSSDQLDAQDLQIRRQIL